MLRAAGESSARDTAAFRAFDFAVAGPSVLALAPVLAIIAAAIRIESPGPAVERQRRLGLDFEPFALLVFRTRHRGRPTRVGSLLEQRGLHRLPSLLNVIRGEMSIVGPPPERPAEVAHYPPHWLERFAVKPGLVCLTPGAVGEEPNGRYLEYVRRRSLRLNLRICAWHVVQAARIVTVRTRRRASPSRVAAVGDVMRWTARK